MISSPDMVAKLRKLLDEPDNTRFADEELVEILEQSDSLYGAAALGWTLKATKIQRELGQIDSYSVGAESYKYRSLSELLEFCLKMADVYSNMAGMGSKVVRFIPPEVI